MFMEKIEVPVFVAATPKPKSLKLVVGLLFVLASAVLMVPWLLATAFWIVASGAARLMRKVAGTIHDSLLFCGEAIVGH